MTTEPRYLRYDSRDTIHEIRDANYELLATDNWQLATKYEPRTPSAHKKTFLCKTNPISRMLKLT